MTRSWSRTRPLSRKRLLAVVFLFVAASAFPESRSRADDGNLWRLRDNPALGAVSEGLSLGVAVSPRGDLRTLSPQDFEEDLVLATPLVSLGYTASSASNSVLRMGTSLGPWDGFALGYRTDRGLDQGWTTHNLGLLYRPLDAVSLAVTLDDVASNNRVWGAGFAARPFTVFSPTADWLTLTTDLSWSGQRFSWERVGGRLSWEGIDLRLWYEPPTGVPGLELTVALGPSETVLSQSRLGQGIRWSPQASTHWSLGTKILKIRGTGVLDSSPRPTDPLGLGHRGWNLPSLVDLLHRAAQDNSVVAIAFEDPPEVGGLASAEVLRQAVLELRQAGKTVYVHAGDYPDGLGFQGWITAADRLSLDPTGTLWLKAGGARRLYFKDFFDKIGIRFVNLAPWTTKSAYNNLTYASMPEDERAMLKRFYSDQDALAVDALRAGRGSLLREEAADLVAQGPWFVGQEILDRGLVDALESEPDFEDVITKEHPGATFVDDLEVPKSRAWGPAVSGRTVALVHLVGDIVPGPGQAGVSIGRAAAETLRQLRNDGSVRAIILRVDSPGGAVSPSDLIAEEVKKTVAAGKPVVVVMGDMAASGGYYLSAPATRIYAQPGTLTGSIGVTATLFTGQKALELLGIHSDGVDIAPSSSFGDWTRDLTGPDGKKWRSGIEATYDRFLDVVAEGRHLDKAVLEPRARGQIYTGREALALGLVDELGGQEQAVKWLEKELGGPVDVQDWVPGEFNPWADLLGPLATAMVKASDSPTTRLVAALDPLAAPWAEALTGVVARGPGLQVWVQRP